MILKSRKLFKSQAHDKNIKEINKIALSINDDKNILLIELPQHHRSNGNVCKTELLNAIYNIKLLTLMIWKAKIEQNII